MLDKVRDAFGSIGDRAIHVVDRVGRKRGLIGLAIVAAAAAGAIVAVKLIRGRRAAAGNGAGVDLGEELASPGVRIRRGKNHGTAASAAAH